MGDGSSAPAAPAAKEALSRLGPFSAAIKLVWQKAEQRAAAIAATRATIAAEALKYRNRPDWAYSATKGPYGPGTNKCNLFVYDVLAAAGAPVPMRVRWSWREFGDVKYPPLAGQWADPGVNISGWVVLKVPPDSPQPGDVAAMKGDYDDASGHVGIVTSLNPPSTVSVPSDSPVVEERGWGFRPNEQGQVVFRRYVGAPEPEQVRPREWPHRGRIAP